MDVTGAINAPCDYNLKDIERKTIYSEISWSWVLGTFHGLLQKNCGNVWRWLLIEPGSLVGSHRSFPCMSAQEYSIRGPLALFGGCCSPYITSNDDIWDAQWNNGESCASTWFANLLVHVSSGLPKTFSGIDVFCFRIWRFLFDWIQGTTIMVFIFSFIFPRCLGMRYAREWSISWVISHYRAVTPETHCQYKQECASKLQLFVLVSELCTNNSRRIFACSAHMRHESRMCPGILLVGEEKGRWSA